MQVTGQNWQVDERITTKRHTAQQKIHLCQAADISQSWRNSTIDIHIIPELPTKEKEGGNGSKHITINDKQEG